MKPIRLASLLVLLVVSSSCSAQWSDLPPEDGITDASVTRVITTLAADDMRGRAAFSPDALRAADFVASEFAEIGLDRLDGLDGYLQRFAVYSVMTRSASVTINGEPVADDHFATALGGRELAWTQADGPTPVIVEAGGNLMQSWQDVRRSGGDALIVVDPSLADQFARLRGFMARGSRTTTLEGGTSMVVVLGTGPVTSYEVKAEADITESPLANVAGKIPGKRANEYVLFSGHYDHIGIRPAVEGDSIANGANDDASGTTAVIELARYYKAKGKPERTLLFVAFTAEESGGYGSRHFSEQLDPDQIVAMFNIEMIGKPATSGPNTAWITGFERSTFGEILQSAVVGTGYEFYADPYPDQNLFFRSDNATLARLGVPAHSISTTPIDVDPDYHQVSDEVETLDMAHMTATIRAIALGAETIITGVATPSRVDPESVQR